MTDDKKAFEQRIVIFICVVVGGIIAIFSVGAVRTWLADNRAREFAKETGIDTSYTISSEPETVEEAMRELYDLAVWAEGISPQIDKAFGYKKSRAYDWKEKDPGGFASKEELDRFAMWKRWKHMHQDLSSTITDAAETIIAPFSEEIPFSAYSFSECFYHRWFDLIIKTVDLLDQGKAEEAYSGARFSNTRYAWKMVPMDIGFTIYPDLMVTGCEKHLDEALNHDNYEDLDRKVMCAYQFSKRYNAHVKNLKRAQDKRDRMLDAKIRSYPSKSSSSSRKSSSSGTTVSNPSRRSSFDPDDHDIEAYYDDNRDEYDDYDDAYEGFLDDDSAWDDY